MSARSNHGSIPKGYVSIKELLERATAAIYGDDAVAEIEATTEGPGEEFIDDDGVRRINPRIEVTRAGNIIPYELDTGRWSEAQGFIQANLVARHIHAFVEHPETGKEYKIPAEYWRENVSSLAFASGTYDAAQDQALGGRLVFFEAAEVEGFLSELEQRERFGIDPGFFDKPFWGQLQTVAWIYTRDKTMTSAASPARTVFGWHYAQHTLPSGERRMVEIPSKRESHLDIMVRGSGMPNTPFDNIMAAEADLIGALSEGRLSATGLMRGEGSRTEIPAIDWLDLQFQWWRDDSQSDIARASNGHFWTDLRFRRNAILEIWRVRTDGTMTQPEEDVVRGNTDNTIYETGAPGRPTSRHLVAAELERRHAAKEITTTSLKDEATSLAAWLKANHSNAPTMTVKTVANAFRDKIREYQNAQK